MIILNFLKKFLSSTVFMFLFLQSLRSLAFLVANNPG